MGDSLLPVTMGFNRSLRIESRVDRLTGDPGAVLLREIVEQSSIIDWMTARLTDPLKPGRRRARPRLAYSHRRSSGGAGLARP